MKESTFNSRLAGYRRKIGRSQIFVAICLLLLLILFGQLMSPGFGSSSQIMNILSLSSFLGIIALGQTIVVLAGGEGIDLSVGAMVSLACVMGSQIMDGQNMRLLPAIGIILLTAFMIGLVNGIGVSYLGIPPLIVTLAMSNILAGLALVYTGGQPKGRAAPVLKTAGSGYSGSVSNMLLVWLVLAVIAILLLQKTRYGKMLYGVGANHLTAALSGANSRFIRALAYGISAMIAAVAGLFLLGYTETAYLDIGSTYVMPSVAAVVIGGVSLGGGNGSYAGVITGAITLTTLNSLLLTLRMGEGGRQMVFGFVLLFLLIVYGRRKKM